MLALTILGVLLHLGSDVKKRFRELYYERFDNMMQHGQGLESIASKFNDCTMFMFRLTNIFLFYIYFILFMYGLGNKIFSLVFIFQSINLFYHVFSVDMYHSRIRSLDKFRTVEE